MIFITYVLIIALIFFGGKFISHRRSQRINQLGIDARNKSAIRTWKYLQNSLLTFSVLTALSTMLNWSYNNTDGWSRDYHRGILSLGGIVTFLSGVIGTIFIIRDRTTEDGRPVSRTYLAVCWLSVAGVAGVVIGLIQIHNNFATPQAIIGSGIFTFFYLVLSIIAFYVIQSSGFGRTNSIDSEMIARTVTETIVKNQPTATLGTNSVADELTKFAELLEKGLITQEEFDAQRKKLL